MATHSRSLRFFLSDRTSVILTRDVNTFDEGPLLTLLEGRSFCLKHAYSSSGPLSLSLSLPEIFFSFCSANLRSGVLFFSEHPGRKLGLAH